MKRNITFFTFFMLMVGLILAWFGGIGKNTTVFSFAQNIQEESQSIKKEVYFTFDDGPSDSTTPYLLDLLKEEKVPATFFLIGNQIDKREKIVWRIYHENHSIGVHSNSHDYAKIYRSQKDLNEDISLCSQKIYNILGYHPSLYRFPGGSFTVKDSYKKFVKNQGYKIIDWNISLRDSEFPNASVDFLYKNGKILPTNPNHLVILCHDAAHHKNTIKAVKKLIEYYKNQGYSFNKF